MRLHRLHRSAVVYWTAAFTLAALTALAISRLVGTAEASVARFGTLRTVPVASRALDPGHVVDGGDVLRRRLPAALLPAGPVVADPEGRVAVVPVVPGEPLLASKLSPDGLRGAAALMPPGTRALAVPNGPGRPPLRAGDVVDVLATFEGQTDPSGAPTFVVATRARVVDVAEETVTVAVTPSEAPRVAFAITRGTATLALTADPSG